MLGKILVASFFLLFTLTPVVWTPLNYELFEYNKMMFVYLLTVIITSTWLIKMIAEKRLILRKTPLDIPLVLFLIANILSTIFSMDQHVSLWGYYSRSNGGLLSLISFILLYYALVSNFDFNGIKKLLKGALVGGAIVALWAIPEHFIGSPSCLLLTGELTNECWVQDVQARVFSTLGQPNWLGAYLAMLIFLALYFLQATKSRLQSIFYLFLLTIYYLAFTFTYSRGATFGLVAGIIVYLGLQGISIPRLSLRFPNKWQYLAGISMVFIIINLVFGSALTSRGVFNPPTTPKAVSPSNVTQLEAGGTESGAIRLIVWKGAVEIFKQFPLFGSGVETFAYSYYRYRPQEHNLVSEWDFLYNKAHNEYLNYLATTGILGILTYLALIAVFILFCLRKIIKSQTKTDDQDHKLLTIAILASYSSYLVQNIFGFSVVAIALFFYTFPAFVFTTGDKRQLPFLHIFAGIFLKRKIYQRVLFLIVVIFTVYLVFKLVAFWVADTYFSKGLSETSGGNPGSGYNLLLDAVALNRNEPLYRSELGYSAASAAVSLQEVDATLSGQIKDVALNETDQALTSSPNNISLWRTAIRTYYQLASIDKNFDERTLEAFDKAMTLAPTDPKLYQSKAQVLRSLSRNEEAIDAYKRAAELKPNYRESYLELGEVYEEEGEKELALENYNIVLKLVPNDPQAKARIEELEAQ